MALILAGHSDSYEPGITGQVRNPNWEIELGGCS
jgi:hypothetical protein